MKNHYQTLGLPMGATEEQIRKRYRELVRQYHPDVNPSPEAKEQFLRIQEAYQVLSDPERRRHYDALLRLQRRESARQGTPPRANSTKRASSSSPSGSSKPRSTESGAPKSRPAESLSQEAQRAILEAERAFIQGRLRDALSWAKQASRLQPRHPKGYEIQGDVYRVQGHLDAALNAYTYALQFDPHNPHLQRKFERVVQATRGGSLRASGRSPKNLPVLSLPAEWKLYAGQSLGWGAVLFTLVLAGTKPGEPLRTFLPFLGGWSFNLLAYLLLAGFLTGFLMRVSQWVAPLGDAFPWERGRGRLSAGSVLVGLGALCFPLTVLLYALLVLTQGGLGQSATRLFSVIGGLTLMFAVVYPYDWLLTLAFGGNLLFTSAMGGWFLGDSLSRP